MNLYLTRWGTTYGINIIVYRRQKQTLPNRFLPSPLAAREQSRSLGPVTVCWRVRARARSSGFHRCMFVFSCFQFWCDTVSRRIKVLGYCLLLVVPFRRHDVKTSFLICFFSTFFSSCLILLTFLNFFLNTVVPRSTAYVDGVVCFFEERIQYLYRREHKYVGRGISMLGDWT